MAKDFVVAEIDGKPTIKKIEDALPAGGNTLGKIDIATPSVISTVNSTTVILGISATFTGTGEIVQDYATISILVTTDQPSATDGLVLEYSPDNTNWDDSDTYTITGATTGVGKFFTVAPEAKYFRVRYINGTTAQTYFRLQTIYHLFRTKPSSHRISDSLTDENDAELVKAIISGKRDDGSYGNVLLDNTNRIRISSSEVPSSAQNIARDFVKNAGSDNLRVNDSVTPVVFTFPADSTKDILLHEIRFTFGANSTIFDSDHFGSVASALTNGVLVEVVSNSITTTLVNLKTNPDFATLIPQLNYWEDQTGSTDFIVAGLDLGGLIPLKAGTSDVVRITIRDNLTAGSYLEFRCLVWGEKV